LTTQRECVITGRIPPYPIFRLGGVLVGNVTTRTGEPNNLIG